MHGHTATQPDKLLPLKAGLLPFRMETVISNSKIGVYVFHVCVQVCCPQGDFLRQSSVTADRGDKKQGLRVCGAHYVFLVKSEKRVELGRGYDVCEGNWVCVER